MSAPRIDPEEVRAARADLRDALGSRIAEKASDEYCLAVARRVRTGGTESLGLTRTPGTAAAATVVEFQEAPVPVLPRLTELPGWSGQRAAVETLVPGDPTGAPVRLRTAVRQKLVEDARTAGYRSMGEVYQEIERLSGGMLRPQPEVLGDPQIPTAVNQVCWLNRTVRTFAPPEALAEVAAADAVTALDLPRRLRADADVPNHRCIGLPAYQQQHPGLTGRGVTVAVIDGEVALAHPALARRVVQRRNYTTEAWGNPSPHGTAVAGIVGAADPADAGIAPEVLVTSYKVLATAPAGNADDFGGAVAIQQALEDGADVANCSWGAGPAGNGTSREARAADNAWRLGLVVVKSAGNRGPGAGTMTTPADAAGILVVGATALDGERVEDYSSRGPAGGKPGPDVVAPGGGDLARIRCCLVGGGFGDAGVGTSYAAPHVASIAALFLQQDPDLVPDQIRDRLRATARPLPGMAPAAQGAGLVCLT
ncbi:S8 family serine peptidase [Geodermatophilus sp. YIM 151500]|uniref:S8 family peptidase n=1 Tax=Geodermatophilus sp. YIM 151500 TaxID=2984531 RepID=UPI0021E3D8A8|nr:S8 family serine peptidase [Geodermatophilus sp. YIM 151500]MCV2489180.1 S8 family serine peptidase [Geodermatophilus sp. YIM 151500]